MKVALKTILKIKMKTDRILYIIIILTIIPFSTFSNVDMEIQAGFGNYHKSGHWIFLRNTLTNSGPKIDGELLVNIRESSVNARKIFTLPLVIPSYDIEIEDIYLKPEGFRHNLKVYFNNNYKEEIISREAALKVIPEDDILILVLGNDPDSLDFLAKADTSSQENPDIHIVYSAFINDRISEILPGIWKGYDSVDVVILGDISLQELSLNQQQALIDWVSAGGNLIISGGINSRNLMEEHIEKILPVKLNGETFLLDQNTLQRTFDSESILGQLIVAESTPVPKARIIISDAKTRPVIVEKKTGYGRVIYMAFDYMEPAFLQWKGNSQLWKKLIKPSGLQRSDISRTVKNLLISISSTDLPSLNSVIIFLSFYIIFLTFVSYIIYKKVKKSGWVFLFIPFIIIFFSFGSLGFVYLNNNSALTLGELSVVDIFQDIDRARVYSYFSLFSPSGNSYKVSFNKPKTVFLDYISVSDSRKYVYGDMSLIQKNGLILEISNPDIANPQLLCGELYVKLGGNIEINSNNELISHFPFDLDECYYFSDGQYFFLGDIKQGKSLRWDNQGNIPGISSIKDEGKQIFINSMRRSLSQRISGRGIIGWMKDSALRSLAGINPGQTYRKTGSSLVIIHL